MKTTSRTPGNWFCQKSEMSHPNSVRLDIVADAGEFSPFFVAGDALPADANLICSAPDMLDALQAICDAFGDQDSILIEQCKAALYKAKGGAK